jgi:hypothetical protein
MSTVLVDWLHHPANPIFWPFSVDGSYYVAGLLLVFMRILPASIVVAIIAFTIMVIHIARTLNKSGYIAFG